MGRDLQLSLFSQLDQVCWISNAEIIKVLQCGILPAVRWRFMGVYFSPITTFWSVTRGRLPSLLSLCLGVPLPCLPRIWSLVSSVLYSSLLSLGSVSDIWCQWKFIQEEKCYWVIGGNYVNSNSGKRKGNKRLKRGATRTLRDDKDQKRNVGTEKIGREESQVSDG